MKQIRRGRILLLCLCMTLSLCACGGKQDTVGNTAGGKDTEETTPSKEEPAAPPSGDPLPLSQYIQSSEVQILYIDLKLDKNSYPRIYLIQDSTIISANNDYTFTFGELSKMSDEEIIQAVLTADKKPKSSPCLVYLQTDSTGNAVKREVLCSCNPRSESGTLSVSDTKFEGLVPMDGTIYDSTYTGYRNRNNDYFYLARGEQVPFVLDEIGAEGVEIDPGKDKQAEMFRSIARVELPDGTQLPSAEDGAVVSCPMTGDNQRILSPDDIQLKDMYLTDFSPSVLNTTEGREALIESDSCYSNIDYLDCLPPTSAHETLFVYVGDVGRLSFYNDSDMAQGLQDLTLNGISTLLYARPEGRTGTLEGIDTLIREYGSPSGAMVRWNVSGSSIGAIIAYYWQGDGFFLFSDGSNLIYQKTGIDEPAFNDMYAEIREEYLDIYRELYQLLSN